MLNLEVVINKITEDQRALINVDTNEIILNGDYYHDKIYDRIEGFFDGLNYGEIHYNRLEYNVLRVGTNTVVWFMICKEEKNRYALSGW